MAPKIRPWHEDREQLADLIEWLRYRAPIYHGDDHFELFRIRDVSDVLEVMRNPGEFSREWIAFTEAKVEEAAL